MFKKLATIFIAAGIILPLAYSPAEAAPAKATAKKKATKRITTKSRVRNKSHAPALLSVEGMTPDHYHCEMGKTFTLYRYPHDSSTVILDWAGTRQQMHRVQTRTGAERYETNAKLTYIGVSNLTQLIDFKQSKPILSECRNEEQNRVQHELDMKKAGEKYAKVQQQQEQAEAPKKKKKSWWPF